MDDDEYEEVVEFKNKLKSKKGNGTNRLAVINHQYQRCWKNFHTYLVADG